MIGLDTNIVLRWLAGDTIVGGDAPHQSDLVGQLITGNEEEFFINTIVVVEIIWVLRQRVRLAKQAVIDIIENPLNTTNVIVQDRDVLLASVQAYSQYPGDFSDHLIGETNRRNGCRTTYTFDRAASKTPFFTELTR